MVWKPIFSLTGYKSQFTADEFLDEVVAEFSESQIRKSKEVDVFKYFCDFIITLNDSNGKNIFFIFYITLPMCAFAYF